MALRGYLAEIKEQSSSIAFTEEATTTSDNLTYKISNSSKEIWALDSSVTIKNCGVESTEDYRIDRLSGSVVFSTVDAGRIITVSGSYVLLTTIAQAKKFSFKGKSDALDSTIFNVEGFRSFKSGLKTATADLARWYTTDHLYFDMLMDKTIKVIAFYPNIGGDPVLMFALLTNDNTNVNVGGLVEESLNFQITTEYTF